MKSIVSLLIFIYTGFVVYSIALFWTGEAGLRVFNERLQYRDELIDNIDDLNLEHKKLSAELSTLRSSTEKNRVFARSLGYYEENEYKITAPFVNNSGRLMHIGKILTPDTHRGYIRNMRIAVTVSIGTFLLVLFLVFYRQRS